MSVCHTVGVATPVGSPTLLYPLNYILALRSYTEHYIVILCDLGSSK